MSFWSTWFKKKSTETQLLIDINADSVAGAYVISKAGSAPLVVYAKRLPLEIREGEAILVSVLRALTALGDVLTREGVPLLAREVGNVRVGLTLVCIDTPWETVTVRSEKIERTHPFVFTRAVLQAALAKSAELPPGKVLSDQILVGTVLDGYEIKDPVGKRVSRANVLVLSAAIEEDVVLQISAVLRKLFHSPDLRFVSAAGVRYQAFRTVFPHEEDYLAVDSVSAALAVMLVRRKLLVAFEQGAVMSLDSKTDPWVATLQQNLESITKRYPLPRTFFLIAPEASRAELKTKLENAPISALRLSKEAPSIVALTPGHLTDHIKLGTGVDTDLELELMAIFANIRRV
jgi:hypothetical protein